MAEITVPFYTHVVVLTEYERGWGSKCFAASHYDTAEEAYAAMNKTNSKNTAAEAPDYYIAASYHETMSKQEFEAINR